jgi:xylulokinase
LVLAIDVGTGSVRAALLDLRGRTVAFRAREHDQIVPSFGRAEQRPADWWAGAVASIRDVLDAVEGGAQRVVAVAACGQMHGTVLIDAGGELVLDSVQLWNDKRATAQVSAFSAANDIDALWPLTANPPSVAWPGFKLQWIARHQPEALARAATLLMPKDYINFRLTRRRAMDESDASCTYLFDARTNAWSPLLAGRLGVDPELRQRHGGPRRGGVTGPSKSFSRYMNLRNWDRGRSYGLTDQVFWRRNRSRARPIP